MAFPQIAAQNTYVSGSTKVTTHPVDLPASISSGDLLLLFLTVVDFGGVFAITTPSGWTKLYEVYNGSRFNRGAAYYKVASGSEGSTVNVVLNQNGRMAAATLRVTGHNSVVEAAPTNQANNGNPPSLSPSWGSADTLWLAGIHEVATNNPGAPSGFTDQFFVNDTAAGSDQNGLVDGNYREYTSSTLDPGVMSSGQSNTTGWTIAIQPEVVAPTFIPKVAIIS